MVFPDIYTKEQLANLPKQMKKRADEILQDVAGVAQKQHP
jgi:hypothetical protein